MHARYVGVLGATKFLNTKLLGASKLRTPTKVEYVKLGLLMLNAGIVIKNLVLVNAFFAFLSNHRFKNVVLISGISTISTRFVI